jgi:membrane protein implicated in regulation of membrane protease activity
MTLAWITLAIVTAIVEVSIPHFGVIFVSLGAVAAAAASFLGGSLSVQIGTFAVVVIARSEVETVFRSA